MRADNYLLIALTLMFACGWLTQIAWSAARRRRAERMARRFDASRDRFPWLN